MRILITGVAGFIGFHLSLFLLKKNMNIFGVDNVNSYYDTKLKKDRLAQLKSFKNFKFCKTNIQDISFADNFREKKFDCLINLAAQAGVRHSLKDPHTYINSNILGQLNLLEFAKKHDVKKFIYASSSSVYGGNTNLPFSTSHRVDNPVSLYAASKKSAELVAECYSHLFEIQCIGLRFFTVYGPWGRPDMATFIFTEKILQDKTIEVFNHGQMERDFTYIDDIINGIFGTIEIKKKFKHKIYNLGNSKPELLEDFIKIIEDNLDKKARKKYLPIQPGDVEKTYADINESQNDLNFKPQTTIEQGIPRFISWYKSYYC